MIGFGYWLNRQPATIVLPSNEPCDNISFVVEESTIEFNVEQPTIEFEVCRCDDQ